MEMFLLESGEMFVNNNGEKAVYLEMKRVTARHKYIDCWFRGIENMPKIFFDESWTVLNSYIVSCAMMRHPDVPTKKRERRSYCEG